MSEANKLPGLYPWLRFEGVTCDQWVECYGIELQHIDRKAADVYLEGEADFFETFEEAYPSLDKQRTFEDRRIQFANAAINLCGGSPIEQVFLAALLWLAYGYGAGVEIWDSTLPFEQPDAEVVISPQHQIGNYRVDFAIILNKLNKVTFEPIKIVVECDGHAFHEKTKEQAARDKRRDRDLQIAGWRVLRFTGSEIWRDHDACGANIDVLALKEIDAQLRRRGLIK
jgi:very-short-patch-repair endonuclease